MTIATRLRTLWQRLPCPTCASQPAFVVADTDGLVPEQPDRGPDGGRRLPPGKVGVGVDADARQAGAD